MNETRNKSRWSRLVDIGSILLIISGLTVAATTIIAAMGKMIGDLQTKVATKLDTAEGKLDIIHTQTNSQLSVLQSKFDKAVERISALEKSLIREREILAETAAAAKEAATAAIIAAKEKKKE